MCKGPVAGGLLATRKNSRACVIGGQEVGGILERGQEQDCGGPHTPLPGFGSSSHQQGTSGGL